MSKKDKLTYEQCRQQIAARYKDQVTSLEKENRQLKSENDNLKENLRKAEERIRILTEHNERLLEFMDVPPEDMEKVMNSLQRNAELQDSISGIMNVTKRMMPGLFGAFSVFSGM